MNIRLRSRTAGRLFFACALVAPLVSLRAQVAPDGITLDTVVVSATRTPVPNAQLGSAVTLITADDLARRQVSTLGEALSGAGSTVVQTGGAGGATSVFIRGAESKQTLFLVDGIRASDANTAYQSYIGGASTLAADRIEVVRGPQSTVYGADAIGGVVSISTQRGQGVPAASVFGEAGSFGTVRGGVSAQGEQGANAFNVSVSGLTTQNDRENNDFEALTSALRVDHAINDAVAIGGTLRVFRGVYGSPGDNGPFGNNPQAQDRETDALATMFATIKASDDWDVRVTLGGQERNAASEDRGSAFASRAITHRGVADAQVTYSGFDNNRITVGGTAEWQQFDASSTYVNPYSLHTLDSAVFAQEEWDFRKRLFLTAGLRQDEFDSFGGQTTGRVTGAWQVIPDQLKLRASYGSGFRAPSFYELYATSPFGYQGNPNLRPEHVRGWDAGLDYELPGKRGLLTATYFRNDYRDLIDGFVPISPGVSSAANIAHAHTQGVELSAAINVTETLTTKVTYTYLDTENETTGARLARRPRNAVDLDVWNGFGGGFSAGAGLHVVASLADVDASSGAPIKGEDYTTARIYAAWQATDRLTLKARVENLFDEDYSAANGYPSLGIGIFGGAVWRF